MILIVGLGNPGQKFEKTRHNVGFRIIDELLKSKPITVNRKQEKFKSEIFEVKIGKTKIILAKPKTFMNESGSAVKRVLKSYKLKATSLFIIHDDIDLPLGKIRISIGHGSAGHKGVQSIIDELKTRDFVRFRIGIKLQETRGKKQKIEKFVLQKFNKKEREILKGVIKKTCWAIEMAITEGIEKAMNEFNKPST